MGVSGFPSGAVVVGSPVVLGYASVTANQTGITVEADLTGLSVSVVVPAGRQLKITGFVHQFARTAGTATYTELVIQKDGAEIQRFTAGMNNTYTGACALVVDVPTAGAHTYKLRAVSDGTVTMTATSVRPAFILVEDITGIATTERGASSTLGYAEVTANQGSITTPATDLTGLSVTVVVPDGRRIKVTGQIRGVASSVNDDRALFHVRESTTTLNSVVLATDPAGGNTGMGGQVLWVGSPSAGSHTYKLSMESADSGTLTMNAAATFPAFILVEDIT